MSAVTNVGCHKCLRSQVSAVTSVGGHKCRRSQVPAITNAGGHKCRRSQVPAVTYLMYRNDDESVESDSSFLKDKKNYDL